MELDKRICACCQTTTNEKLICIYPNITHDFIYVKSGLLENEKINIELINPSGQTLLNVEVPNNFMQIDLSNFSKGVYFIKIKNTNFTRIEKVIKI